MSLRDSSVILVAERFNVLREKLNLLLDKSSIPLFDTSEMKREDRFIILNLNGLCNAQPHCLN